jgi:hypothetical protein
LNKKIETTIKERSMKKSLIIIAGIVFLAICAFQFVGSTPVSATDQPPVIQPAPSGDEAAPAEEAEEAVEGEVPPPEEGAVEETPAEEEAPEGEEGEEMKDSGDQG